MAKSTKNPIDHDLSKVPIYYADQPAGLAIGAHISRLTFGVEEDDKAGFPRPIVTVAIPTVSLLALLDDLNVIFDQNSFKKSVSEALLNSAKVIATGRKHIPSKELIDGKSLIKHGQLAGPPKAKKIRKRP
jgi:hypothetical protein